MKAYKETDITMSYEEVEGIFEHYFDVFEETFGEHHKNIKLETIKNIIEKLSFCEHSSGRWFDLEIDDYKILIDQHFKTRYDNCDYSISHFMSGYIRANRLYETIY